MSACSIMVVLNRFIRPLCNLYCQYLYENKFRDDHKIRKVYASASSYELYCGAMNRTARSTPANVLSIVNMTKLSS